MTRPHIIRADTIDLQDHDAPSAKDHSRHPAHPGATVGGGPAPAPHQAGALRSVELELSEQHGKSPRASQDLSGKELQLLHDEDVAHDRDPNENLLRNSGQNGVSHAEDEVEAGDSEDGLEDDMIDKISSSPSIGEDGSYTLPLVPHGLPCGSCCSSHAFAKHIDTSSDVDYSSPFSETPQHLPVLRPRSLLVPNCPPTKDHHQKVLYASKDHSNYLAVSRGSNASEPDQMVSLQREQELLDDLADPSSDLDLSPGDDAGFRNVWDLLLPMSDPVLDVEPVKAAESSSSTATLAFSPRTSSSSWEDEAIGGIDDDDTEDFSFPDDSRFIDSGWGGECLRDTEEIDFDFVYALHTFVATVEGQANATKGDTMVLLDDSNSYWWLVRVVKDSSIGYLPAEHIETPTERLARLNKHRNLDLSQTMLTDQEEDKKSNPLNPLKKAMRRRNVKTVQFAPPSYVEPSDYGDSSDEQEGEGDEAYGDGNDIGTEQQDQEQRNDISEGAVIEPLKPRQQEVNGRRGNINSDQDTRNGQTERGYAEDASRTSDEIFDRSEDGSVNRSRKGTVRNTDSFFKDDSVETRKINLTPSLLRDDSNSSLNKSGDNSLKNRSSLESFEKDTQPEKSKDDRKKKEKRGMLGGMFKRKEKKIKGQDKDLDDGEKTSSELARHSPQPKESMESLSQEAAREGAKGTPQSHRQIGKLQKSPPVKLSPKSSYSQNMAATQRPAVAEQDMGAPQIAPIQEVSPIDTGSVETGYPSDAPTGGTSAVQSGRAAPSVPTSREDSYADSTDSQELQQRPTDMPQPLHVQTHDPAHVHPAQNTALLDQRRDMAASTPSAIQYSSAKTPVRQHENYQRLQDDFDSSDEEGPVQQMGSRYPSTQHQAPEPDRAASALEQDHHLAIAQAAQHDGFEPRSAELVGERSRERLSESPVQETFYSPEMSSPHDPGQLRQTPHRPPPLMTDTSSTSDPSPASPVSPASSDPRLMNNSGSFSTAETSPRQPAPLVNNTSPLNRAASSTHSPAPQDDRAEPRTAVSSTSTTPTWSDASLRAYLDNDDSEIRDLLLVVHDKTGLAPPKRDHPVVKTLYKAENEKLDAISSNLDGLLGQYLARKGRTEFR